MRISMNLNRFDILKKTIQILLPISVVSFVVSQSSILDGLLNVVYSNGVGSTSPSSIKFFEYRTERNYAFLLFNGLLALIIKNSGLKLTQPRRPADSGDAFRQKPEEVIPVRENEEGEENNTDFLHPDVIEITSSGGDQEDEEDHEEVEGVISVDELNRKCDDFIKKMRERIETDSDLHELQ